MTATALHSKPNTTEVVPRRVGFAGRDALRASAALFPRERVSPRVEAFSAPGREAVASDGRSVLWGEDLGTWSETVGAEGPQWRVEVAPGLVAVRSFDPARAERAAQRAIDDARVRAHLAALRIAEGLPPEPERQAARVTTWSAKSRSRMLRRMLELDFEAAFSPLEEQGWKLGMVTLTYPGDWLTVAPGPDSCRGHIRAFREAWERKWGPLSAVWKREFQRRGAPHYHLGCMIPADPDFTGWLSATWAAIVAHPDPEQARRHRLAGTGVDYDRGFASSDPRRFAIYFGKHGVWSAKDYQNEPPAAWEGKGVGRFWGYWRIGLAVESVDVAADVAQATVRAARRWHDARGEYQRVFRWRKVSTVDRETGEIGWKWRRRRTRVRVRRLTRSAGYLAVPDGALLAAVLSRVATYETQRRPSGLSGAGPVGWLP
jgi:hypothetical protein